MLLEQILRITPICVLEAIRSRPRWRQVAAWLFRSWVRGPIKVPKGVAQGLWFNIGPSVVSYALGIEEGGVQLACQCLVQSDMVVYDIGANVGFFTIIFARLTGKRGRVYAFEPVPDNTQNIAENAKLNGMRHVTIVQAAVANEKGMASFLWSGESTTGHLVLGRDSQEGHLINVSTIPIDWFVFQAGHSPPDLVKIDVEGSEVEVLWGMVRTLQEYKPILLCEMHGRNTEVAEVLKEVGYTYLILGGDTRPLEEAEWNAYIVACAEEDAALLQKVADIPYKR